MSGSRWCNFGTFQVIFWGLGAPKNAQAAPELQKLDLEAPWSSLWRLLGTLFGALGGDFGALGVHFGDMLAPFGSLWSQKVIQNAPPWISS